VVVDDPHGMHASVSVDAASEWLAGAPDVVARLEAARHPRIADVGCGRGVSTLALAHAFLDAHVDGLDDDPASISDARRRARGEGLDGRVRFLQAGAGELTGPYDLILIRGPLHDPAAALTALAAGGTVLVATAGGISRLHP
jgi:methylase of polypeptide subunit release factors